MDGVGQPAKHIFRELLKRGVTGVVNLRYEYDYILEVGGTSLDYLFLPVKDDEAPTLEQLGRGVSFILAQLEAGGKVYVHCWEGLGRGPTMAAAYLIGGEGCTVDEAWRIIKKNAPVYPSFAITVRSNQRICTFLSITAIRHGKR